MLSVNLSEVDFYIAEVQDVSCSACCLFLLVCVAYWVLAVFCVVSSSFVLYMFADLYGLEHFWSYKFSSEMMGYYKLSIGCANGGGFRN